MKKLASLLIPMVCVLNCLGQKQDNQWYLSQFRALSFVTGSPVVVTGNAMWGVEACASIADNQGNLLFYTEGIDVWDVNNQTMPNGTGLQSETSPTQIVIVPFPADTNKYYIFHFTCPDPGICVPPTGLNYSIVDMRLNSGLGDLDTNNKDVPLILGTLSEKVMAVRHGNGIDWWVITHDMDSTFIVIPVTDSGIGAPISQTIGNTFTNMTGEMEISPNGERLVSVDIQGFVNLLDFDRCEGVLSNPLNMSKVFLFPDNGFYGCAFSPDNNLLYVAEYYRKRILQYNLNASNIAASENTIFESVLASGIGGMQLGPNGKVYFGMINTGIGVIDNPNVLGIGCNASQTSLFSGNVMPLPTMPNYNLQAINCGIATHVPKYDNENFSLFPNPFIEYTTITGHTNDVVAVELWNISGTLVERLNVNNESIVLYRNDLPSGLYLLRLIGVEGELGRKKVIILE